MTLRIVNDGKTVSHHATWVILKAESHKKMTPELIFEIVSDRTGTMAP